MRREVQEEGTVSLVYSRSQFYQQMGFKLMALSELGNLEMTLASI